LSCPIASTAEGSCCFASSDASNLSSFVMSAALGAVPRIRSSEAEALRSEVGALAFERVLRFEAVDLDCERVVFPVPVDLDCDRVVFRVPVDFDCDRALFRVPDDLDWELVRRLPVDLAGEPALPREPVDFDPRPVLRFSRLSAIRGNHTAVPSGSRRFRGAAGSSVFN
jgi:hypothetical protein